MAKEPRVNFTTGMQNSQSVQPKVVSTPPPKDEALAESLAKSTAKYTFYCTHATMNCNNGLGQRASFRNHVFRTDDEAVAEMLKKDYIGRKEVPFIMKQVTEIELQELLSQVGTVAQVVIEPIPDQGQNDPNPDLVSADGAEGVTVVTDEQLKEKEKQEDVKETAKEGKE